MSTISLECNHTDQMDQYGFVWNFPKKSAAKSNAERAWQTTVNKDSTMVRNQKFSSNDRDQCLSRVFRDETKTRHYPCNARVSRTF